MVIPTPPFQRSKKDRREGERGRKTVMEGEEE